MEGPLYPSTFPFRPIPVYGHIAPNGVAKLPVSGATLAPFPLKKPDDRPAIPTPLEMVTQMNHLRALGEYQLNQLRTLRDVNYSQLYEGLGKFNRNGPGNAAPYSPNDSSSSMTEKGPVDFSSAKHRENSPQNTGTPAGKPVPDRSAVAAPSVADRVTVPVIVSCANPFASQYGYGRKVFPCPQCRYTTDRRNNLKRHMLTMHQTCSKILECCGILFATKASLREHAMIFHYHGYTCFYCGRRFCRKALLKRHLSVHNGQKDFVCAVCDYATSHKSNLERHRKVHCRPEDMKSDDSDGAVDFSHSLESWRGDSRMLSPSSESYRSDAVSRDENVIMSCSDDENEEINVDSD